MTKFNRWRQGCGICARLFFLMIILTALTIPVRIASMLPISWNGFDGYLVALYYIIVVPLFLPRALDTCGLGRTHTGYFDNGGTMNKASRQKMKDLEAEYASKQNKPNKSQHPTVSS